MSRSDDAALAGFRPVPRGFYMASTVEVAQKILGCLLVCSTSDGLAGGWVVETEAYGPDDPGSHAFRGERPRNRAMFGDAGHAYVYRSHGIHWCVNAVTQSAGIGEAVLIRAIEPLVGIEQMQTRRGLDDIRLLCAGPGRLCQALGIDGTMDGCDLTVGPVRLFGPARKVAEIVASPRIGLSVGTEQCWRFCAAGSRFLSRPDGSRRRNSCVR